MESELDGDSLQFVELRKFGERELRIEYTGTLGDKGITLLRKIGNFGSQESVATRKIPKREPVSTAPVVEVKIDRIINDDVDLIVNTTEGRQAIEASRYIRQQALARRVTYSTTLAGAMATCHAIASDPSSDVYSLRELHEEIA